MVVPFGISVGDFIAVAGLLIDAYDAIQSTGGAASDYRQQSQWLLQLIGVLRSLETVHGDDISQLASQCVEPLQDFYERIRRKYEKQLAGKSSSKAGVLFKSLQWAFLKGASKDLVRLKNAIGPQLQAISLKISQETRTGTARIEESSTIRYEKTTAQLDHITADIAQVNHVAVETFQATQSLREETRLVGNAVQDLLLSQQTAITEACYGQLTTLMKQAVREALQDQALQWQSASLATTNSTKTSTIQFPAQSPKEPPPPYSPVAKPDGHTTSPTKQQSAATAKYDSDHRPEARIVKRRSLGFGSLKIEVINVQIGSRLEKRVDLTFQPAKWTFNRGALISLQQVSRLVSGRSITIKPNTFNVVSLDSEIFTACSHLDLERVQELFEEQKASPFDRDEFGGSLIDWTLNALLESPGKGAPENFKLQELVRLTKLLLDSGLRFEPKPNHPIIKATALQVFLSSGHLLGNRREYGISNSSAQAWDEVAAYIYYSLSMDDFTNTLFHLDLSQFLKRNIEDEGNYIYFEHNLPFICWDGVLRDDLQGRLYKLHPRRALTALMKADDFVEACAPRSVANVDQHLRFLQTAIRDQNPAADMWVGALSKLMRKGRRLSKAELEELAFCAERYSIMEHWKTALKLADYPENATDIPDISEMRRRRSIPGAWIDDEDDDADDSDNAWDDMEWTGRREADSPEVQEADGHDVAKGKAKTTVSTEHKNVKRYYQKIHDGKENLQLMQDIMHVQSLKTRPFYMYGEKILAVCQLCQGCRFIPGAFGAAILNERLRLRPWYENRKTAAPGNLTQVVVHYKLPIPELPLVDDIASETD